MHIQVSSRRSDDGPMNMSKVFVGIQVKCVGLCIAL